MKKVIFIILVFSFELAHADIEIPEAIVPQHEIQGDKVQAHWGGEYGGGSLVGTPIKISEKGRFVGTWETTVNFGSFPGSTKYQGKERGLSLSWNSEDEEQTTQLIPEIQGLDQQTNYLFVYVRINPWFTQIEDERYQIVDIYPLQPGIKELIPREFAVRSPVDEYDYSVDGVRSGKIIDVYRFGGNLGRVSCLVTLNLGGLKKADKGATVNHIEMSVESEEACRYSEKVMLSGATVEVNYSEAHTMNFSTWMTFSEYQIHSFKIIEDKEEVKQGQIDALFGILGVEPGDDEEAIKFKLDSYIRETLGGNSGALEFVKPAGSADGEVQ